MNNPVVSICVQTYNQKDYIKQCLDGILMQQTTFPFEIILGEDESDDGTREICIDYANTHPDKIRLFLRSRKDVIYINGNPTGRYNFMENLKQSKGKYIALCEGDDYWTDPLKLQKQVDFLEANSNYAICFHRIVILNQKTGELQDDFLTKEKQEITDVLELANGNFIHTPSVVMRNDFKLPKWFSRSPIGDWSIYMIAIKDKKIKRINDVMAVYRLHPESIWSSKSPEIRMLNSIKSFKLFIKSKQLTPAVEKILKLKIACYKKQLPKKSNYLKRLLNYFKSKILWKSH